MSTSSVPKIQFTPSGLVLPQESVILDGVYQDYNAALGGNLNPALETPQGQLISSTTAIIGDHNSAFAEFVNQVDPDVASGFMQDAIGRIYFLNRHPATSTVVQCICTGVIGTVIPQGSLITDQSGNIYQSLEAAVLNASGQATVNFECLETGPIVCPENAVKIYRAVVGWENVDNPSAGITGSDVENRSDFEFRRRQSVAKNAHGSLPSIYGAVFDLDNVIDVYAIENTRGSVATVGATNYQMQPHSIYVAVVGGDSDDIGLTIWTKKNVGCDYNGNTAVTVTDDSYSYPKPTYEVKFQRPALTPVLIEVQIAMNALLPSNINDLVKAAVISTFNGSDGGARARIGGTIFASRFYAGISKIDARVEILQVLLGLTSANATSVALGIDQAPTISESQITVVQV
ncbi:MULTISPECIES: baseplate J/gp47 family protein [Acinetobacter]|uniref:baseplate J/gp47 family protein n=1 Tax=Acinetobacter TaxID=469 RepID=UPI001F4A59A4|nr:MULTISPECIES: baseplate J/gp47 family protein [unclassified Acinetobacter]MCH7381598.1 baseplate J/gp47 family protein [Acinetobacter higginsii]